MTDRGIDRWEGSRPGPTVPSACAAPSVAMDFDPYGNVTACCANVLYPLGSVKRATLAQIWSGERANRLRSALRRGDLSYGCGNCRHRLLYHGGEVARDVYDAYVPSTGLVADRPQLLGFSLNNTCNLACIMCGADASSRIRRRAGLPRLTSAYGEEFFRQLEPFLTTAQWVDFRGGEPFLVAEHHRVWDLMEKLGLNLPVSVTTNGTVWDDRVESVLDRFDTSVVLSLDGVTPATFESIRTGAELPVVLSNLDRFRSYAAARGTSIQLSFCLLQQNWFEMADVLLLGESLAVPVSIHTVLEPAYGAQRLPTRQLAEVVAALEAEDDRLHRELSLNLDVWVRELSRLRSELEDRHAGRPRRWVGEPPGPDNTSHIATSAAAISRTGRQGPARWLRRSSEALRAWQAARELRAWSDESATGAVVLDDRSRVRSVDVRDLPVLSTHQSELESSSTLEHLWKRVELVTASRLWVSEEFVEEDRVEHLLLFGSPVRDRAGLIVRAITVPRHSGVAVLLAVDLSLLDRAMGEPSARRTGARTTSVSVRTANPGELRNGVTA